MRRRYRLATLLCDPEFRISNETNRSIHITALNRRKFLAMLSAATAGTAVAPLGNLYARSHPQGIFNKPTPGLCIANGVSQGFGPIVPKLPLNAAELTDTVAGDLSQAHLLELPQNFSYTALSITGQTMGDGSIVPGDPDGMACFMGQNGNYVSPAMLN